MNLEKLKFFAIALLLLAGYVLIIVTAYRIQIVEHQKFNLKSSRSGKVRRTVIGKRGGIFDKNGVPLAISEPKLDLSVDPRSIIYKREMAGVLATITKIPVKQIHKILMKKSHYAVLKRDVPYEWKQQFKKAYKEATRARIRAKRDGTDKKRLKKLIEMANDFNMIRFESGYKRVYPQNNLFSNVLGFVRPFDMKGLDGIEYHSNRYLSGKKVKIERFRNAVGKQGVREVEKELKNNSGKSIYLTIDARIQYIAEEELAKMMEKSEAKWGTVTIINPADGKIIAIANYPNYNPEKFRETAPENRRNFAASNLFEPGSTLKIFSLLGVLNANLVTPGELIFGENGLFYFGRRRIRDHEKSQWMTLKDIVVHSSNIGTVKLVDRLTKKELYDYFLSFGFGKKSGIDIVGESYSPLRNYKKWYPIDKANMAFGQGLMVNSIQMVRAFSALYNNGVLWSPRLIDHVVDPETDKPTYHPIPEPEKISFKYNSNKKMIAMLEAVVNEGTARKAQISGITVGGKTGTSQKYDPALKKYSWTKVVASFIGAVPNEIPKMIMMVVIDQPTGREYGGTVAAPVFQAIAKRALPLLGTYLPPEIEDEKKKSSVKVSSDVTTPFLPENDDKKASVPEGYVTAPNVIGMDLQKAALAIHNAGLEIQFSGESSEIITEQSPEAGAVVPFGTVLFFSMKELSRELKEEAESE